MPVNPHYRRFQLRYYHEYSERDAGITHLWHAQRLAESRLRSTKGIADAPDVDFRHPERIDVAQKRTGATSMHHLRRVATEEQRIVRGNTQMQSYLMAANDPAERVRRGINNFPTPEELRRWHRCEQHVLARRRDRVMKEKTVSSENAAVLRRLCGVAATVPCAESLAAWYASQQRRAESLRRFRRAERFAGERVLRRECGLRAPVEMFASASGGAAEALVWRQRPPPVPREALRTGPMLPSLREAAREYTAGNDAYCYSGRGNGNNNNNSGQAGARPEWKSISALDETLMHYASDMALVHGAAERPVRRSEESGVTQLWRSGVQRAEAAREKKAPVTAAWEMTNGRRPRTAGRVAGALRVQNTEIATSISMKEKAVDTPIKKFAAGTTIEKFAADTSIKKFAAGTPIEKFAAGTTIEKFTADTSIKKFAVDTPIEKFAAGTTIEKFTADTSIKKFAVDTPIEKFAAGTTIKKGNEIRSDPAPMVPFNEINDVSLPRLKVGPAPTTPTEVWAKGWEVQTRSEEDSARVEEPKAFGNEEKTSEGGMPLTEWVYMQRCAKVPLAPF